MRPVAPKGCGVIGNHQIKPRPMTFAGLAGRRGIEMH